MIHDTDDDANDKTVVSGVHAIGKNTPSTIIDPDKTVAAAARQRSRAVLTNVAIDVRLHFLRLFS